MKTRFFSDEKTGDEMIEIALPADKNTVIRKANDDDKTKYAAAWKDYEGGKMKEDNNPSDEPTPAPIAPATAGSRKEETNSVEPEGSPASKGLPADGGVNHAG